MEDLNKEFQAEVVDEDVANGHKEISDNLCPTTQGGTRKTDVSCHPEACEEGDGKLEHEGCDVGREGDETKVEHLRTEDEMVENIIQHPFQHEVQATAGAIAEQLQAHELAERWIEEVDGRGEGAFDPGFYVFEG